MTLPSSELFQLANCIRALSIDAVEAANSGHPGMPMGMADAAAVLFARHLKFDAANPSWPDRDRFVLSNGHGSMLLYSVLHLTGYTDMPIEEIKNFRQWGSKTPGHPEYGHTEGVETTTGPLGQGLASAVGMAIAERALAAQFGSDVVDHRTYVCCGDGCLMEGVGQEAVSLAGHLRLAKLTVLYDDNNITIDGSTSLSLSDNIPVKFEACGWSVEQVDGHDHEAIDAALRRAKESNRPTLIALKTIIGYGSPTKAGKNSSHGAPLGANEAAGAKAAIGWTAAPFETPESLLSTWREVGRRGSVTREQWKGRFAAQTVEAQAEFLRRIKGDLPQFFDHAVAAAKAKLIENPQTVATRKASQIALETLTAALPEMIGGSADLTHSNLTRVAAVDSDFGPDRADGRYVSYGIREFAMAAAMNGMAVHGGLIPFAGTFLVFSDYARNAIRLSALMGTRVVYVLTHDSIGLGEDGPTHQPVEHLASLRAMPNLHVFRPADTIETLECWAIALQSQRTPSVLALSRQNVPQLRTDAGGQNFSAHGAYVIRQADGPRDVSLLATGTEVSLAVETAKRLEEEGLAVAVVSMPSWDLFEAQSAAYKQDVLGTAPRIAIEAAGKFGWTRYVASEDDVIGMPGFGASAPAETLYKEFGITSENIIARARLLLGRNR
ncbi:transketolase [Pararhizobium sp. A13]|uniref:transketolase n=1 Tax=Pararhizobium sp. A13 TaxID=3133975 RepID=UPI00311B02BE